MNRLVRAPRSFVRSLQVSRVSLHVFVEGEIDAFFYGQICQKELSGLFRYRLWRSQELSVQGRGKSHLLKHFDSLRRRGMLVLDFKGHRSACIYFLDKDIDDLRRTKRRSMHVVYTDYYEVENYIFRHGKLIVAAAAACLRDTAEVESVVINPSEWSKRAAGLWADWLKLCLAGCLFGAMNVCHYSAPSQINVGPALPVDPKLYAAKLLSLQKATGYPANDFVLKFGRLATKVDYLYARDRQDTVFKGKWYRWLLADELRKLGIAAGSSATGLEERITRHLLQSLDFDDYWSAYHRSAVQSVLALLQ